MKIGASRENHLGVLFPQLLSLVGLHLKWKMESRFLFLSFKTYRHYGIADYHQQRLPGLHDCFGGRACTDANPMTMLNGPGHPGIDQVGVYSDGSAHQTTFGSITTSYFSPRNVRES
jgi:hypothetical protein